MNKIAKIAVIASIALAVVGCGEDEKKAAAEAAAAKAAAEAAAEQAAAQAEAEKIAAEQQRVADSVAAAEAEAKRIADSTAEADSIAAAAKKGGAKKPATPAVDPRKAKMEALGKKANDAKAAVGEK